MTEQRPGPLRLLLARHDPALAERIAAMGLQVVWVAPGEIVPVPHPPLGPREVDVLLWTSANAVQACGRPEGLTARRVVAVGPATARAALEAGWPVDVVPAEATGAQAVRTLGDLRGQRVLWPCAAEVEPATRAALDAAGARVEQVVVYDNRAPAGLAEAIAALPPVDRVILLAPSAARRIAQAWGGGPLPPAIVIGPSTERAARLAGFPIHAVASPHDTEGLLQAIRHTCQGGRPR